MLDFYNDIIEKHIPAAFGPDSMTNFCEEDGPEM